MIRVEKAPKTETDTQPKRRTLFALAADMLALHELLEECGGDITNEATAAAVDAWFAENQERLGEKVDGYVALIREYEAREVALKAEADRLVSRRRTTQNAIEGLKTRLQVAMDAMGTAKIETDANTVTIQTAGGKASMELIDEAAIPEAFGQMTWTLDKEKVRAALEAGQEVPGARLKPRGKFLRLH
jgi:hypothetical protein